MLVRRPGSKATGVGRYVGFEGVAQGPAPDSTTTKPRVVVDVPMLGVAFSVPRSLLWASEGSLAFEELVAMEAPLIACAVERMSGTPWAPGRTVSGERLSLGELQGLKDALGEGSENE